MAIELKSPRELQKMRVAGALASRCLEWICGQVVPGMSTGDIDDLQTQFAKQHGVVAAPLNYRGFPKSICTSVNEVICHGIPSTDHILVEGDIIGIDVTLVVEGYHGDNAATIPVGTVSNSTMRLLEVALDCNRLGIEAARAGGRLGDIGHAIQTHAEPLGYSVVTDFVGHGIGRRFHEDPHVSHAGVRGKGVRIRSGMAFTIEPMINEGVPGTIMLDDGWTAITADGKLSAQFEHTLAVTEEGVTVMTTQNETGAWEPPGRWYPPGYQAKLETLNS